MSRTSVGAYMAFHNPGTSGETKRGTLELFDGRSDFQAPSPAHLYGNGVRRSGMKSLDYFVLFHALPHPRFHLRSAVYIDRSRPF